MKAAEDKALFRKPCLGAAGCRADRPACVGDKECVGQILELLAEGLGIGCHDRIGDQIIYERRTRSARIAEPAHLDWRRSPAQDVEAATLGVAVQFNQY